MKKETCEKWYGTKHTFGKWKIVEEGNMMNHHFNPPIRNGFWVKQERVCEVCNYKEIDFNEEI